MDLNPCIILCHGDVWDYLYDEVVAKQYAVFTPDFGDGILELGAEKSFSVIVQFRFILIRLKPHRVKKGIPPLI